MIRLRLALETDKSELVRLERIHAADELSPGQGQLEGACLDGALIGRLIASGHILIAEDELPRGKQIVGYLVCGPWREFAHWPMQRCALSVLKQQFGDIEQSSCHYGPVWVSSSYRGRGLCRQLWQTLGNKLQGRYSRMIALIGEDNEASIKAHVQDDGMQIVDFMEFADRGYYLTSLDLK